jgi:hypothetical protein
MEFRLLDQGTRRQWESAQVHGSASVLVGAGAGSGPMYAGASGEKVKLTGLTQNSQVDPEVRLENPYEEP